MSIQKIQAERVLEDIARNFYSSGVTPSPIEILAKVEDFFGEFIAGQPLSLPDNFIKSNQQSNVDDFNQALNRLVFNMEILYNASLEQVNESMQLVGTLTSRLDSLKVKRQQILTTIDDYLLGVNNTDGYFLGISDNFADISKVDIAMTSAHIDTGIHSVVLPTLSSLTKTVSANLYGSPNIQITVDGITTNSYDTLSEFSGALNGYSNSAWGFSVSTDRPSTVSAQVNISMGDINNVVQISRIDYEPYGISPTQWYGEVLVPSSQGAYVGFGGKIQTGTDKMVLIDNPTRIVNVRFTFIKKDYDYVDSSSGTNRYVYLFGAKQLSLTQHVYDNQAIFVSKQLTIPVDLKQEAFIDAVSLEVDSDIPNNTSIQYYVASDNGTGSMLGDFSWRRIDPVGTTGNGTTTTVVNFNGAQQVVRYIRSTPKSNSDLKLIPSDPLNADPSKRNPSSVIIPSVDVYRLATFTDTPPTQSLSLDEGINTTRIYYTDLRPTLTQGSLDQWGYYIVNTAGLVVGATPSTQQAILGPPQLAYGRIDTGNQFFYGGDIGESSKSVYVETFLQSDSDQELFLADVVKSDPNSQLWDMRIFLNGNNLGYLPVGMDILTIPWLFRQGLNHIAIAINIPAGTPSLPNPYIGSMNLMNGRNLYDYGTVKLGTLNYVSMFELQHNTVGNPQTFTIYNNEIISRRQPTDNYLLRYSLSSGANPHAGIRVRADLARQNNNINVSPKLNSYRVRFAYGDANA